MGGMECVGIDLSSHDRAKSLKANYAVLKGWASNYGMLDQSVSQTGQLGIVWYSVQRVERERMGGRRGNNYTEKSGRGREGLFVSIKTTAAVGQLASAKG